GGAGHRAEDLAVEGVLAGDIGVVGLDEQALARDEVRPGEGDALLAGVRDRVGRDDEVDLVGLEEGLALGARGLDPLDVALVDAELGSDALGDLDIEAGVLAAFTKTETGLVELDADAQAVEALAVVTA